MTHGNDMRFKLQCPKIKFYWNAATFIHFCIIRSFLLSVLHYSCFVSQWQFSSCNRDRRICKPKIFTISTFKKKFTGGRLGGSVGEASDFSSDRDLAVCVRLSPVSGSVLTAQSLKTAFDSVSPSFSAPPLSLCLYKK